MHFHVITLFPEVCKAYTDASVLGRAQKTEKGKGAKVRGKKIAVSYYTPRDFAEDKHAKTDDRPYGGGPGMVMKPDPILRAVDKAVGKKKGAARIFIMSPRGAVFTQDMAKALAKEKDIVFISGRYEGIDARVKQILNAEEVSVGDYVLTGGELPALTMIDAIARHVPGVLGTFESLEDDRAASGEVYTRPDELTWKKKKYSVPEVLKSGNHAELLKWRSERDV
ncbi:MAG: tRNA ((1)-)-methyltransferase, tRNA (guanine37-N1)-methyltransferase [Candidatus Parcubacteria bacterium]|jgi:tRNA (guanine37-N1)-methyltransferase